MYDPDCSLRGKYCRIGGTHLPHGTRAVLTIHIKGLVVAFLLGCVGLMTVACGDTNKPLPEESAEAVVEKFYEFISEAKIRGGQLLIREAYKLTSGGSSRFEQAKFVEVVNKYPSGFKVVIINSNIQDRHADVTIEYEMSSSFGDSYTLSTVVPLVIDEETNTWKIDFRGDSDDQDMESIVSAYQKETSGIIRTKAPGE